MTPAIYIPGEETPRSLANSFYVQDVEPALFVYRQRFRFPGDQTELVRDGVMGLLNRAEACVFPHEEIIPDRVAACVDSLRSTDGNTGSLWLWCDDSERSLFPLLQIPAPPVIEATDQFGCLHQIWRVTDQSDIKELQSLLRDKSLFLADGHHRYAAGSNLATIQVRSNALRSLASHRAIINAEMSLPSTQPIAGTIEELERYLACPMEGHSRCIVVTPGPVFGGFEFICGTDMPQFARGFESLPIRGIDRAIAAVESGSARMALLVAPFSIATIELNARRGVLLPPKSTDFYPKLAAGLVVHRP